MTVKVVIRLLLIVFIVLMLGVHVCHLDSIFPSITFGIITNDDPDVSTRLVEYFDMNITLNWRHVDGQEAFQIYRALHEFDQDGDIDAIMLFGYDASIVKTLSRLKPSKLCVRWGEHVHHYHSNITDIMRDLGITMATQLGTSVRGSINDRAAGNSHCARNTTTNHWPSTSLFTETTDDVPIPTVSYTETIDYLIPRGIVNIIKDLKWKHVILFHDFSTESIAFQLIDLLSEAFVLMMVYNVEDVNVYDVLRTIYYSDVKDGSKRNFALLCNKYWTLQILNIANTFDSSNTSGTKTALSVFSRWLVTGYDHDALLSDTVSRLADSLDNVLWFVIPHLESAKGEDFTNILHSVLVDVRTRILMQEQIGDTKMAVIQGLQKVAATMNPLYGCTGLLLDTLMWTGYRSRGFSTVGHVDMEENVRATSDLFPNMNYGYNNRYFSVSTMIYPTLSSKEYDANGTEYYVGLCHDLLNELARKLNFTYSVSEPEDMRWGAIVDEDKGLFNGLIGQLQRKEVDIAAAPLSVDAQRVRAVDFTSPFKYEFATVMFKKPDPNLIKWRTLLNPFKWEVLATIGGLIIAVSFICYLLELYNPYYRNKRRLDATNNPARLNTWHAAFWCMYAVLFNQGSTTVPRSTSGRTLVSCWALTSVIISATYCGNLIAFLTVNKSKPPFNTLEEMLQAKDQYQFGTLRETFYESALKSSKNELFRAVWAQVKEFNKTDPSVTAPTSDEHIDKVRKGYYAYICDLSRTEITRASDCNLMTIKERFLSQEIAFALQKDSPHTRLFSKQIMRIHESGLLQLWMRKWWPKANFCATEKLVTDTTPVSLLDVQSAFYVCVIGVVCSCIAFVFEQIISCNKKREKDHVTGSSRQTGSSHQIERSANSVNETRSSACLKSQSSSSTLVSRMY